MEHRVTRLEGRIDKVEAQIFELHTTSMAFVTEKFEQMERRLMDKIEDSTQRSATERMQLAMGAFGWVIALAGVAVAILHR